MYWQVYLHKTVVSAENTLIKILKRAKQLIQNGEDIFTDGELTKNRGFLWQVTNAMLCALIHGHDGNVMIIQHNPAIIDGNQANHHIKRCGFTCTIGTE